MKPFSKKNPVAHFFFCVRDKPIRSITECAGDYDDDVRPFSYSRSLSVCALAQPVRNKWEIKGEPVT